jgi:hypothetical protein
MARNRRRSSAQSSAEYLSPTPSLERGVFLIDREPILKRWRKRYLDIDHELREVSEATEEFHLRAMPAYQAWIAQEFGTEMSALREMAEKIREAEMIYDATVEEARVRGVSPAEAYRTVLARKKKGEDLFPSHGGSSSPFSEHEDWEEGWDEVDPETEYRAKEERTSKRDSSDEVNEEPSQPGLFDELTAFGEKEEAPRADRLKALYRKLAFALHPDANPAQTSRERKIWDEVQEAYRDQNLERLEMLHAWVESGSEGWLESFTHVGTLQTFVLAKLRELRSTRASFHRLRKEAPWKFWKARDSEKKLRKLREATEEDFVHDFLLARRHLQEFEQQFKRWSHVSASGARPRRRS